jgi:hypothetical protein
LAETGAITQKIEAPTASAMLLTLRLLYRILNRIGTVKSKVSPGMFAGGGGNGCARRTVSIVS